METHTLRNVAKRVGGLTIALILASLASAGQLSFTAGSWSSLTGSAAGTPSLYQTQSINPAGASIAVKTTSSGSQTLRGTWSFSVQWRPDTVGETPPANIQVTLKRAGTPTVDGNGIAKVEEIVGTTSTELLKVDSANLILSDITKYLPDKVVVVPLVLQTDGTYKANGSVISDLLTSSYNSISSTVTSVTESFTLAGLEGTI